MGRFAQHVLAAGVIKHSLMLLDLKVKPFVLAGYLYHYRRHFYGIFPLNKKKRFLPPTWPFIIDTGH